MERVSSSRCHKCGKAKNISELVDNDQGIGKMCKDVKDCEIRINNNKTKEKGEI